MIETCTVTKNATHKGIVAPADDNDNTELHRIHLDTHVNIVFLDTNSKS